ncbi:MAG: ATP-binding protein [Kiritimatiellia bacterium]|jgi:signal transduction histidine kinase|nr:ATP-binding protein [Kiritimatiellia bacterium]
MPFPWKARTIAGDLILWLSATLIVVVILTGICYYFLSTEPMEEELELRSGEIAVKFSDALEPHLWNIDEAAIRKLITDAPVPNELSMIRVLTEHGDPVFERKFGDTADLVMDSRDVYHEGELIGSIEVGLNKDYLNATRLTIAQYSFATVVVTIAVVVALSIMLLRLRLARPLRDLATSMQNIAQGDYGKRLPASRFAEINWINDEVNTMARQIADRRRQLREEISDRTLAEDKLKDLSEHLEEIVESRTNELIRSNLRLHEEISEKRRAQDEILQISSREQQRIGKDLHDTLGQLLAGASLLSGSLAKSLRNSGASGVETAENLTSVLGEAMRKTRNIARGLDPLEMEAEGLLPALQSLCENTVRVFKVDCKLSQPADGTIHDSIVATHLYRIANEAVHNAIRHAGAAHINIELHADNRDGRLLIQDDGRGMPDEQSRSHGMGIRIMRYRSEAIGGKLDITSNDFGGVTVISSFDNTLSQKK